MKFRGSFVLLSLVIYLQSAPTLCAFDTGHHTDLTRAALRREGYSQNVTDAVVLQNWITDLYGNWPMWTTLPLPRSQFEKMEELKRDLEKLHFDNLYTEAEVRAYWEQLVVNTKEAIRRHLQQEPVDAASDLYTDLAVSLHAVQDFYSHSNWVECYGSYSGSGPFDTKTWFDRTQAGPLPKCTNPGYDESIHTEFYRNEMFRKNPSGIPDHEVLNKDRYSRDQNKWAQAYVYAYAASVQWAKAFEGWVQLASLGFPYDDFKKTAFCGKDLDYLQRDLNRAYETTAWVPKDGGHWKGNGSSNALRFGGAIKSWAFDDVSTFKNQFIGKLTHSVLARDLYLNKVAGTNFGFPIQALNETAVIVKTVSVFNWLKPFANPESGQLVYPHNNMQGRVSFAPGSADEQEFIEATQNNTSGSDSWPWISIYFVRTGATKIAVRYTLISEEATSNYRFHIVPKPPTIPNPPVDDLNFEFLFSTNSVSGDLVGSQANMPVSNTPVTNMAQNPPPDQPTYVEAKLKLIINSRALN